MEIRHLLFFKKVAETQHLTRAANELFVSQSHLSHVIIELENELGVALFDRVGRGIQLNPYGREFYNRVLKLAYDLEDAKKEVVNMYNRQSIHLTLVTNVSTYMPLLLKTNKVYSPNLNIHQHSEKRRKIIRMLLDGEADFAITCPPIIEEPDLETIHLRDEQGVVIYPDGHWLQSRTSVSLKELNGERFISVTPGYGLRDVQDVLFRENGLLAVNSVETSETMSIYAFVKEGLGIALVPKFMTTHHDYFSKQFVEIDEHPIGSIGLTWRKGHYKNEAYSVFYDNTVAFFKQNT